MLKLCGRVIGRYKGEYTDRNGEVRTKIVYSVADDDGSTARVTDFNCKGQPFSIDENVNIPVIVSMYIKDGAPKYRLSIQNNDGYMNMTAF